jgi:hypothetical protein
MPGESIEFRVRIQVLCEQAYQFDGDFVAQRGDLNDPRNLSMDASTTAAFRIASSAESRLQEAVAPSDAAREANTSGQISGGQISGGQISGSQFMAIRLPTPVDRWGVDVTYTGSRDGQVQLNLSTSSPSQSGSVNAANPTGNTRHTLTIPVEDLIGGVVDHRFDGGIRVSIGRPGGDAMRVAVGHGGPMIFSAGESVPLSVDLLAVPDIGSFGRPLELKLELRDDSTGQTVWQGGEAIDTDAAAALATGVRRRVYAGTLAIPTSEGVYTLRSRLVPSGQWRLIERIARTDLLTLPDRIVRPDLRLPDDTITRRSTQFVVLGADAPKPDPTPLREISRWTPNQRNWIGIDANSVIASQPIQIAQHASETVAVMPPDSYLSQPIRIAKLGQPHILVVRYARDQPVKMSVSIRQTDEAGAWTPLGMDTAIVDDWSLDQFNLHAPSTSSGGSALSVDPSPFTEHRVVFWPRVQSPLLVISNENSRASLKIESISIEAGPASIATGNVVNDPAIQLGRMAAVYLDKPLLTDPFGCARTLDADGKIALDDWTTFLQAGNRLVDYVQASGANSAILTVISEGGSLFPTDRMLVTPRYDTGVFFSDGRDPVKKDVLELLLRLFDRAGLQMVVSVELGTPIAPLEELAQQRDGVGIRWVDALGRGYLDSNPPRDGIGSRYNVLDPRVEQELAQLVGELARRYSHHQAFAGLGLQIGPQTLLQLPPPAFGRDPQTLERFRHHLVASQTGNSHTGNLPTNNPSVVTPIPTVANLNAWLQQVGDEPFVRWRADQLTATLRRLAAQLAGKPLVLVTADYHPPGVTVPGGDALQAGLDWHALGADPAIVPLRLIRRRLLVEPARRVEDASLNEDVAWDESLRGTAGHGETSREGTAGSLLFHPPSRKTLALPASQCDLPQMTFYPQAVAGQVERERELARVLEHSDNKILAIGGWGPNIWADPSTRQFLATFASLPRQNFTTVQSPSGAASVVRVRQHRADNALYAYVVNHAPWEMYIQLECEAAAGTRVRRLGPDPQTWTVGTGAASQRLLPGEIDVPRAANGLSTVWSGTVQPGQLVALEIQGPAREIARWHAQPTRDFSHELTARVDDLTARVAILGYPRPMSGLINGGFESVSVDQATPSTLALDGWMRSQHPSDGVRVAAQAFEGKRAVQLKNDETPGARTWLLSKPLETSETGRMAVSIRLRVVSGSPTTRLALEGRYRGTPLRYSVNITPISRTPAAERSAATPASPDNPTADQKLATEWPEQAYWLYVPNLPEGSIEDLRIAIDLTTAGEVAIDDVQLYDFFFTQQERDTLQRQTFVAAERLRKGDPSASIRLLDSHWARYLRWLQIPTSTDSAGNQNRGPTAKEMGIAGEVSLRQRSWQDTQAPTVPQSRSESTTLADRIRQYLPAPLRF